MIKSQGIKNIPREILHRLFRIKAKSFTKCIPLVQGRFGLEIGGPSSIFKRGRVFPIYPLVHLDNCVVHTDTIWHGKNDSTNYLYDKNQLPGIRYICDTTELKCIPDGKYDFVVSSHVLEHIANPIKAFREWIRVTKEKGIIIFVIPMKDKTFDHRRPATDLAHIVQDFANDVMESDLTHLPEVLELHDFKRDSISKNKDYLERTCKANEAFRYMHHHVFETQLALDLISQVGLNIIDVEEQPPYHIILIAQKP